MGSDAGQSCGPPPWLAHNTEQCYTAWPAISLSVSGAQHSIPHQAAARSFSRAQLTPQQQEGFPLHQSSLTGHAGSKNKSSAHAHTLLYLLFVQPSPPLCSTLLFNDIFAQACRIAPAVQFALLICSSLPATISVPRFKDGEDSLQLPAAGTRNCTFGQYLNTAPKPVSPVFSCLAFLCPTLQGPQDSKAYRLHRQLGKENKAPNCPPWFVFQRLAFTHIR